MTDRRRMLSRCDTAPSMTLCQKYPANSTPGTQTYESSEIESISQEFFVGRDRNRHYEPHEQKYLSRKQRGCSPPSNIKYRIRHKSAASTEYRRKLSDTCVAFFETKSNRSQSVDLIEQINEATIKKLSRSLGKRIARSGSAKNLMEFLDESTLVWNEEKPMQKEINSLFKSIENNDVRSVEAILQAHAGLVNTRNNIDLAPLDVAMLYNYSTMSKRLIEHGAINNECFDNDPRLLQSRLTLLAKNCSTQLHEFCTPIYNNSSINRDMECLQALENELKLFKSNLDQMKPGSAPRKVTLEVAGLYSLLVTVYPPSDSIVPRYKIEWSRYSDFQEIEGKVIVRAKFPLGVYQLSGLVPHVAFYARVSGINLRGVGPSLLSFPAVSEPSCWTESLNLDQMLVGTRRCPHPQEWCPAQFDNEEERLEQQLRDWLSIGVPREQKRYIPGLYSRRSLLKTLFISSTKFVRQPKRGLYIAIVYKAVDNGKFLACGEEQLPFVMVDDEHPNLSAVNADCIWLMRLLANNPDLRLLVDVLKPLQLSSGAQLRSRLITSLLQLQTTFATRDLGLLYPCVIHDSHYNVIVLTKQIPIAKQFQLPTGIKWSPLSKMSRRSENISDSLSSQTNLDEELYSRLETFISFFRRNNTSLEDGLYLGYVRFRSTLDQLYIQENIFSPTIFPVVKIRDNWHVDKEEWDHFLSLKSSHLACHKNVKGSKLQSAVIRAWQKLLVSLKLKSPESDNCRLYLEEVLWLKKRVSVILCVPSIENFCGLPGSDIDLALNFEWVSLNAFEFYHFHSHLKSEQHFSAWATLHSIVEVLIPITKHCLRQAFDKGEVKQCKDRLEQFQIILNNLEHYWRCLRWSVDVINNCRDKHISNVLTIPIPVLIETDVISQAVLSTAIHCPEFTKASDKKKPSKCVRKPSSTGPYSSRNNRLVNNSHQEVSSNHTTAESQEESQNAQITKQPVKGTIRVYAGYPCGLLEGTSVKLLLNSRTTSSDVIKLIVTQLNTTSMERNPQAPKYLDNDLSNFCLIVTMDKMSRPLPDNFHPLLLKQPWKSGKFSVKLKSQLRVLPDS